MSDRVAGRVARAHGLTGEVAVEVLTSVPDIRFAPGETLVEVDGTRTLTVERARPHQGRLLVTFVEVTDRSGAEALNGVLLAGVDEVDPPEGEIWAADLEGFRVALSDGTAVGIVREVLQNPAHDLLAVARPGAPDALVPFVPEFVASFDEEERVVVITPPKGLLDS